MCGGLITALFVGVGTLVAMDGEGERNGINGVGTRGMVGIRVHGIESEVGVVRRGSASDLLQGCRSRA